MMMPEQRVDEMRAARNLRSAQWRLRRTGIDVIQADKWSMATLGHDSNPGQIGCGSQAEGIGRVRVGLRRAHRLARCPRPLRPPQERRGPPRRRAVQPVQLLAESGVGFVLWTVRAARWPCRTGVHVLLEGVV